MGHLLYLMLFKFYCFHVSLQTNLIVVINPQLVYQLLSLLTLHI